MADIPFSTNGVGSLRAARHLYLVLPQIGRTHTITIPIPDAATVAQACASNDGKPIPLFIGYGAVMPMDLELARRVKLKSAEFGKQYDEDAYAFSRARFNGMRPKKHGQFGEVTCRPVYEGELNNGGHRFWPL